MQVLFQFHEDCAIRYGLEEAVILARIAQLIDSPNKDDVVEGANNLWLRMNNKQLVANFPFLSIFKIRRAMDTLIGSKLIVVCDQELKETLLRRKMLCYALTQKGYELTHGTKAE